MNALKNLGFALATATKMALFVLVVGLAFIHVKSPVFLGIVFIAATYVLWVKVAVGAVFGLGFITSLFSKKAADKVEVVVEPRSKPTADEMAAMFKNLSPSEMAEVLAAAAAKNA